MLCPESLALNSYDLGLPVVGPTLYLSPTRTDLSNQINLSLGKVQW